MTLSSLDYFNNLKLHIQNYSKMKFKQIFQWVQFLRVQVVWELGFFWLNQSWSVEQSILEEMNFLIQSHFASFSYSQTLPLASFGLEYSWKSMTKSNHFTSHLFKKNIEELYNFKYFQNIFLDYYKKSKINQKCKSLNISY